MGVHKPGGAGTAEHEVIYTDTPWSSLCSTRVCRAIPHLLLPLGSAALVPGIWNKHWHARGLPLFSCAEAPARGKPVPNWHLRSEMAAETHPRAQLPATLSRSGAVIPPIPTVSRLFSHFPTKLWSSGSQSSRFLWICHSSSASPCCSSPSPSLQVQPLPSACFGETLTAAALSFQHPRSCPTLPPAQSLPHLSIPQGQGDSVNTQGT